MNQRRVDLHRADLQVAAQACKIARFPLSIVYGEWKATSRRASESFAKIALQLTAHERGRIKTEAAANRKAGKQRSQDRQKRLQGLSAKAVFDTSDAQLTKVWLRHLELLSEGGWIAATLFRCQKASTRAKCYGRSRRKLAYGRKEVEIQSLGISLQNETNLTWGWKLDPRQTIAPWVLYIDLPQGQVSFHTPSRGQGPDYGGEWDEQHESEQRILAYCDSMFSRPTPPTGMDVLEQ